MAAPLLIQAGAR